LGFCFELLLALATTHQSRHQKTLPWRLLHASTTSAPCPARLPSIACVTAAMLCPTLPQVSVDASEAEIKRAYRKLSLQVRCATLLGVLVW